LRTNGEDLALPEPLTRWLPRAGELPRDHLARLCGALRDELGADHVAVLVEVPSSPQLCQVAAVGEPPTSDGPGSGTHRESLEHGAIVVAPARTADAGTLEEVSPFVRSALAQHRTWRRIEERREHAELLLEVMDAAASRDELDAVLASVCETVAVALDVRRVCVFLLEDGRFVPRMARYSDGRRDDDLWDDFRTTDQPFEFGHLVLERDEPVLARAGELAVDDWWAERFGIGSAVGVPLGSADGPRGVLTLDSDRADRLTSEHAGLAEAIATHLSGVLERAQVAEERSAQLRVTAAVNRLLEEAAAATSITDAAGSLALVLHESLETEHAVAYLRDREGTISEALTVDVPGELAAFLRRQLVGEAADSFPFFGSMAGPDVAVVGDADDCGLIAPEVVEALDLRSFIALPILGADGPIGVVMAGTTRESRRWSTADRRLAERLAVEGSLVVENAGLREQDQQRIAELSHRAFHDPLTSLPNRALLLDRIEHALARAERNPRAVAVLFVDLDRFKEVNDTLGHDAGDRVLVQVARRLRSAVRPGDTVARISGDEFVLVLEAIARGEDAERVAARVISEMHRPYRVEGQEVELGASVGIALGNESDLDPEDLVRRADLAMYRAKRAGGRRAERYLKLARRDEDGRLDLDEELRAGIDRGELVVRYQPVVALDDLHITAADAHARWHHPRLGLLQLRHFGGIAEEAELIPVIDEIVLGGACQQLAAWDGLTDSELAAYVTLSESSLGHGETPQVVRSALEDHSIRPDRLVLVLREATVMDEVAGDPDRLDALRRTGARLAVGNFGSGRMPLRDLQRLDFDVLKIDPAFVDGAATETGDAALVRAIIDVAGALDIEVVAEGVQTTAQLRVLRELGCRYGQGRLFERPVEPSRIDQLLRRRAGSPWLREQEPVRDQEQAGSAPVSSGGGEGSVRPRST
jgi:diguanylate cyclase (GGDEF)-like protein